ncbi:type II toxin-antitoxin system RelE/ParE family toxin [Sphingomonas sp. CCH5-D11]|uniref:type II toxin-antitoxin system RelE/ParE family toxin n=1 Tax=Sphingomonas sp. CCH5-D11 TaxID=1768786 RepID=UPI0008375597|nr:type II toxin-antitoxin system RelE/ParE family toxin [Sphingomonas sp. CCH5-D11]
MNLIWREEALDDLGAIIAFIADYNEAAAVRLQDVIEGCAERLPEHPFMYRTGRAPGTREAVVHPNYILIYRVSAETVEIVSVVHSRRQYP